MTPPDPADLFTQAPDRADDKALEAASKAVLWQVGLATTLVVASFYMFGPVLAVLLQQQGHSLAAVGAFAMISFVCVAFLLPVMPRLFTRVGIVRAYQFGMALELISCAGYVLNDSFAAWCASAVLGGIGTAAVWNASEALIARYAPANRRGQFTGLYQTALGGAMALGPFVPSATGLSADHTLWLACALQAIGLLLVLRLREIACAATPAHQAQVGTWGALKRAPALAALAFCGGAFEAGLGSISAANGAALGLSLAAATSVVGALGAGSFLLQLPAGLLADRFTAQRVFTLAGWLLLMSSAGFAGSANALWLLWLCAFVWGGVGGALYTLSMIQVAHCFDSGSTAAGAAAMIMGYSLGAALSPLVSGALLQAGGSPGLALWLAALSCAVLVAARRGV